MKKSYNAPTIKVMVVEPSAILLTSGDVNKVQAKSNDSDFELDFGGKGGGSSYDPD